MKLRITGVFILVVVLLFCSVILFINLKLEFGNIVFQEKIIPNKTSFNGFQTYKDMVNAEQIRQLGKLYIADNLPATLIYYLNCICFGMVGSIVILILNGFKIQFSNLTYVTLLFTLVIGMCTGFISALIIEYLPDILYQNKSTPKPMAVSVLSLLSGAFYSKFWEKVKSNFLT